MEKESCGNHSLALDVRPEGLCFIIEVSGTGFDDTEGRRGLNSTAEASQIGEPNPELVAFSVIKRENNPPSNSAAGIPRRLFCPGQTRELLEGSCLGMGESHMQDKECPPFRSLDLSFDTSRCLPHFLHPQRPEISELDSRSILFGADGPSMYSSSSIWMAEPTRWQN